MEYRPGSRERFLRSGMLRLRWGSTAGTRQPTLRHTNAQPTHTREGGANGRPRVLIRKNQIEIRQSRRTTPTNKKTPPPGNTRPGRGTTGGRQADDKTPK